MGHQKRTMTPIDAAGSSAGHLAETAHAEVRLHEKTFRVARRHTFLVRVLRVVFPLAVVAGFGVYGLVLQKQFSAGAGTLRPGKIEVTADDLKMKNPSYFGVTKEGGKYEVRAREAAVDFAMTGPVKLEGIDGDLLQASGVKTLLKATRGALENKKGELELFDGVEIDASNGMKARMQRAMVYTKDHRVTSRDPIRAEMPTGTLTANTMDFSTDTRAGKFRGNVALRLSQTPSANGAQPSIGLGGDARQPVEIHAQEFDIDDLKSLADFRVNVVAQQGETQLTAPELHVIYEGHPQTGLEGAPVAPAGAPAGADPGAQLSRLTARNGVVLTAGTDRRVVSDSVDFDVKADTALFNGNVELTQAKNVFRGGRLQVDRKSGKSRLDTPGVGAKAGPGRIAATLVQAADPARAGVNAKAKVAAAAPDPGNPLGGFRSDPSAPTDIDAETLDVNDQTKQAIFRGKVVARQGDYVIQTSELIAFYTGQTGLMSSSGAADAQQKGLGGAQLSHIETKGGTKIVSKDGQEAEGATAHFDIKSNMVTMAGPAGVTLKQGTNIVQGARLKMDLTKGEAHVENDQSGAQAAAAPTPAQLSIAAKPGVVPPSQPGACPPGGGQTCLIIYPDQLKKMNEQKQKGQAGTTVPADASKPKPDGWQPQSSPSQVYRSN